MFGERNNLSDYFLWDYEYSDFSPFEAGRTRQVDAPPKVEAPKTPPSPIATGMERTTEPPTCPNCIGFFCPGGYTCKLDQNGCAYCAPLAMGPTGAGGTTTTGNGGTGPQPATGTTTTQPTGNGLPGDGGVWDTGGWGGGFPGGGGPGAGMEQELPPEEVPETAGVPKSARRRFPWQIYVIIALLIIAVYGSRKKKKAKAA